MALSARTREARRRHLVDSATGLIRDGGGAGFSMLQLADRAGVSPATPYNLLGSKSELLRLIVADEFSSFVARLGGLPPLAPLARLLAAADAVVVHYCADQAFYRGLYLSAGGAEGGELRTLMQQQGQQLWRQMVEAAITSGCLKPLVPPDALTDALLRTIGAVTEAWLADGWGADRFAAEMALSARLLFAGLSAEPLLPVAQPQSAMPQTG
jgi:AcrR family transcriptional regulator